MGCRPFLNIYKSVRFFILLCDEILLLVQTRVVLGARGADAPDDHVEREQLHQHQKDHEAGLVQLVVGTAPEGGVRLQRLDLVVWLKALLMKSCCTNWLSASRVTSRSNLNWLPWWISRKVGYRVMKCLSLWNVFWSMSFIVKPI